MVADLVSQNSLSRRPVDPESINYIRYALRAPSFLVLRREVASVVKRLATRRENASLVQRGGDGSRGPLCSRGDQPRASFVSIRAGAHRQDL